MRAVVLVGVQDRLGVAVGGEPVAPRLQFQPQLGVVEDLAVEDDPQAAVLVADGLLARAEIDDGEPGVAQAGLIVQVDAELVRAAVPDGAEHAPERGLGDGAGAAQVAEPGDAAHLGQSDLADLA